MIPIREVARYLLQRQYISAEAVIEGDLLVIDATHRNFNHKVLSQHGPSYLLKQGIGQYGRSLVAHEARIYEYLQAHSEARQLRRYLPTCHGYDEQAGVLILELLRDAESLGASYHRRGRFSAIAAAAIGDALGALHRLPSSDGESIRQNQKMPVSPPWVLSMHRPQLSVLREISGANLQLISLIQVERELCQYLDDLRDSWQSNTLIHFDIKGENIVVFAPPRSRRKTRVAIVDWESARMGDACWDVASVFSDFLSFWLLSIPITGDTPPERFLELARYPLEDMQPAIRRFWQVYIQRMGCDEATANRILLRSVQYASARLIQTAYEHMQMSRQLTGTMIGLLQLSLNMLQRPLEAAVYLLGIALR